MTAASRSSAAPQARIRDLAQHSSRELLRLAQTSIGNTPLYPIELRRPRSARLLLKLEGANPSRSIKDRVALFMLQELEQRRGIHPGAALIEATSGNMGVAFAWIARARGYRFIAVTDPRATTENLRRMKALGAEVEIVTERDATGGFLLTRLERAAERARSERAAFPDQHSSLDNPLTHYRWTGPELLAEVGDIGAVFIPASTGGTLAGVGAYLRRHSRRTAVVAVDGEGSAMFGGSPGPRSVNGLGSSRPSPFVGIDDVDEVIRVDAGCAFTCCRELSRRAGVLVGGSSGATIAAAIEYLRRKPRTRNPVCICPDHGLNYKSTIFNARWGARADFAPLDYQIVPAAGYSQ